ncbi:MAG: hypothetical protein OHK0057_26430 [Thermoflexibacter sp.]
MTGVEVLQKIRENEHFRHLPVVAVTAYVTEESIQKFREDGFAEVLNKPINKDQIIGVINKYVGA